MAREKTNALGYWFAVDTVDETGKIIALGAVTRSAMSRVSRKDEGWVDPGIDAVREDIESKWCEAQFRVRVWPVEAVDLGHNCNPSRNWSAKRDRLELMLAENEGTFTPSQAYIDKQSNVAAQALPDPSPYREWSKAKREAELAQAYADGRFTPTEAYLAAHPELEAKAAVLAAGAQITKPRAQKADETPIIAPQATEQVEVVSGATEPEKRAEKRSTRRRDPSVVKAPRVITIMGRKLVPSVGYV
jgi:hypothetical protein